MDTTASTPILSLQDVHLTYRQGSREIHVLDGAAGRVMPGEVVALLGQSGAGKSTLLHIVGLLDRPDSGSLLLEGADCATLSDAERTRMRREKLGFIYQFHHLLPDFSALENVVLPQMILGRTRANAEGRGMELLESMGLAARADHRPAQLSGGEQQRVAIARAVANAPRLLLADEPTGNLDPPTAESVFKQLMRLVEGAGLTAIIATHNLELARRMSRIWLLQDGNLVEASPADI